MKIQCIANKMDVFGGDFPKGYNKDQYVGLTLGKEYIVMGIIKNESGIKYLIGDEEQPIYFKHEKFFRVIDFSMPHNRSFDNWCFVSKGQGGFIDKIEGVDFLMGYNMLCLDEEHYVGIFEREKEHLAIFYQELEKVRKFYEEKEFFDLGGTKKI